MIFELKIETDGVGVKLIGTRFYYTQVPLKKKFTCLELEFTKFLTTWNSSLLNSSSTFFFFFLIPRQSYSSWTSSLVKAILGWNSSLPNSSSKNSLHN